jgi:putative SOS response-associated peptidase YedK
VTQAKPLLRDIHDRMPVILAPDAWDAWLASPDTAIPMAVLQPYPPDRMLFCPVSARVNSPKNDTPDVVAPMLQRGNVR